VSYNVTEVDIGELTVERYFGAYRAAVGVYPSHSSTAGSASSYRLQLSRYYGSENNVQLMYVGGVELDRPTAIDTVLATRVRSLALFGRHWLTREWALTYGVAHTVQGTSTRHAANVGLRLRF
jgi:YaiO family outer membrane protein